MAFLADLGGLTIFYTIVVVFLVSLYLTALYRSYGGKWPTGNGLALAILAALAFICGHNAWQAYCPDADQPHIRVTGPIVPFKEYTYSSHRARYKGILACIGPCGQNVPLLAFDEPATKKLSTMVQFQPLTVVYLARKQDAEIGGALMMRAHPVVEMDASDTGKQIFYIDTTRHRSRAIVLGFDSSLATLTILTCLLSAGVKAGSKEDDDGSPESDPRPWSPVELDLGKHNKEAS